MVSSDHYQSLLNPPKTTKQISYKSFFFIILSVVTFVISFVYLCLLIIPTTTHHTNLCANSHDHDSCFLLITEAISDKAARWTIPSTRRDTLGYVLSAHVLQMNKAISGTRSINVVKGAQVVGDCLELMDLSRDRVQNSIDALANSNKLLNANDVTTWLSAVLTNYVTCSDQLENYSHLFGLKSIINELISSSRIILAIQANVLGGNNYNLLGSGRRKILLYPSWVRRSDKKLLGVSGSEVTANVVVAKDGSGNFTTVAEAVASAPDKGKKRYVIYVKEGVYEEIVEVGKKKKNVMIVGDGMNSTVITGSLNVFDGNTTFRSATLGKISSSTLISQ